ncbi:hypothetical protein DAPPUDRAFT_345177 [Daphnia pulex]|uniref:Uncharacterized protein n=1 Tax=Daphnia pulex TaxID=6669 RepID=E9I786_DAPPU|nr:hypothetical protein DAPPUDRAFT_345177 [Daphnia pulex]|eukprot:EFX60144.1 hypothetical protein DAPPUDRAFT_345177 [Daphnia pulex]
MPLGNAIRNETNHQSASDSRSSRRKKRVNPESPNRRIGIAGSCVKRDPDVRGETINF